jgi:hypothetical protein
MSRLLLQICTAVLALVPIATGIISMRGVRDPLYRPLQLPEAPILDSNLRFFGGVWLGLGLALLYTVPNIERHAADTAGAAVTAAQVAARSWLSLVDRTSYGESWDSAGGVFRHALTRAAWDAAVRKARSPFEPFGARTLLGASFQTNLPGAPPGEYVVLQYQTKVGGGKTVVETVTPMKDQDGSWRVSAYYIRPE